MVAPRRRAAGRALDDAREVREHDVAVAHAEEAEMGRPRGEGAGSESKKLAQRAKRNAQRDGEIVAR